MKNITDEEFERMCSDIEKALNGVSCAIADLKAQYVISDNLSKVPLMLDFQQGEFMHFVDIDGSVDGEHYSQLNDELLNLEHRTFKSEYMAKLFSKKSQLLADCLFWKELYDRDYVPIWDDNTPKWHVVFDHYSSHQYVATYNIAEEDCTVYFSTEEIAQRCVDWLNLKK